MKVQVNNKIYETKYFPFFLKEKRGGISIYTLRYPSGFVEKVLVVNENDYIGELEEYLKFLITEYLLEDDLLLTTRALRLKQDISDLFYESEVSNGYE